MANIYADPSFNSPVTTQAILGEVLTILDRKDDWLRVRQWDNYEGWIYHFYLTDQSNNWNPDYTFQGRETWVHERPSTDAKTIRQITTGAYLPGDDVENGWMKVQLPDGKRGFILDDTEETQFQSFRQRILFTAERYLGASYTWGGKTALGFDCSGFVQTVYRLNGIQLPRDTSQQIEVGELIHSHTELQAGDLVFFKENGNVNHVGITYDADSFIHCSGFVKRNSFAESDPDYSQALTEKRAEMKRIVQD